MLKRITPQVAGAIAQLCRVMEKNLPRCEQEMRAVEDEAWGRPKVKWVEVRNRVM